MKINLLFFIFLLLPTFLKADTISTPKLDTIKPHIHHLTNKSPLPTLKAGEKVMAGDFEVEILEARGGGGNFSGKGFMRVPYFKLAKLNVVFNNIKVNTDRRLIDGYFQAVYDEENGSIVNTTELVKAFGEFAKGLLDLAKNIGNGTATKEQIAQSKKEVESKIKEIDEQLKDNKLSESDKETLMAQKESLSKTDEVLDEVANLKPGEDCSEPTGMIRDENWNPYLSEVYWASNNTEEILKYVYEKINQARPYCAAKIEKALEGGKNAGKESNTTAKQPKNYYTSKGECFLFKYPKNLQGESDKQLFYYTVPKNAKVYYTYQDNVFTFIIKTILFEGNEVYQLNKIDGFYLEAKIDKNQLKQCANPTISPTDIGIETKKFIINGQEYSVVNEDLYKKDKLNEQKKKLNFADKTIEVKGKFKAIAKYNKTAQKWNVTITLLCKKNSKISTDETEFKESIEKLAEEKLKELGGWNDKKSKSVADNDFYVKEMNGEEWFKEICDLGSNVWENATLPENYWNEDKGSKTNNIRMPALFTGVADGGIEMVSDYPQLVKLGYDVATKEDMRSGIWNGVKNITPEKIKILANDAVKEKWKKYNSPKQYIQAHEAGKDGVTVIKMLVGGSLITGIKDVGEKFSKKTFANVGEIVKDIVAKRTSIRGNIIELAESKELARLFAKKIGIKDADFEDWFKNSFKTTEKGTINFQAHHVIPVEILEKNKDFNELLFRLQGKADFDFNGIDNGIMLQAKSINLDVAGHAKHDLYSEAIGKRITEILNTKLDDLDKLNKIKDLVASAKDKLKNEVLLGNKDVNQILTF